MLPHQIDLGLDAGPSQARSERTSGASELSALSSKTGRSQLGADFQPSKYSVICGQGNLAYEHTGNKHFRMIASFVADYSQASRKMAKSAVVSNIVATIREGGGCFCKYEKGSWFEVGDYFACGKVSAFFATGCMIITDHPPRPRPPVGAPHKGLEESKTKHTPSRTIRSRSTTPNTWMTAPNTWMISQWRRRVREVATIPWGSTIRWNSISLIVMSFRMDGVVLTTRLLSTATEAPA
jgi:hypothetical protein